MLENIQNFEKKNALVTTACHFDKVLTEISNGEISASYCLDGIWYESDTITDTDAFVRDKLSEYLGVNVTSVHLDDCDSIGVWIIYKDK